MIALAPLLAFTLLAVTPTPERAPTPDAATAEARKRFARALELLDEGQVAEALVEFRRGYQLKPQYQVLYNIGQACIALARPVEAVDALERYLREGGAAIAKNRRAEVETELARQRARIARVEILAPAGTRLRLDGLEIGVAPLAEAIRLGVGDHVITGERDGLPTAESRLAVAGEDRLTVNLVFREPAPRIEEKSPLKEAVAPSPTAPTLIAGSTNEAIVAVPLEPSPRSSSSRVQRVVGYSLVGAGAVGLGVAGGFYLHARDKHDQAMSICAQGGCDDQAHRLQSQAEDAVRASNIAAVAGSLGVATGIAFLFYSYLANSPPRNVAFAPAFGEDFAGFTAKGAF